MNFKQYLREQLPDLPVPILRGDPSPDIVIDPGLPSKDQYDPIDDPIDDDGHLPGGDFIIFDKEQVPVDGGPLNPGNPDEKHPSGDEELWEWQDCVDPACSNCPPGTQGGCYIWVGHSLPSPPTPLLPIKDIDKFTHSRWMNIDGVWYVFVPGCGQEPPVSDGCWVPYNYEDEYGNWWKYDPACQCHRMIWPNPGPDGIFGTDDDTWDWSEEDTPPVPSDFPPNYLIILILNGQTVYMVYNPDCQCYQNYVWDPNTNTWGPCDGYGPQCWQYPGNVDGPILPIPPPPDDPIPPIG